MPESSESSEPPEPPEAQQPTSPAPRTRERPPASRRRTWAVVALALSGWVALAVTALPGGSPLRWVPVLVFVCFGPGLALLCPRSGPPRPEARLETLALAAPLGVSLAVLTATSLFLAEAFSATAFLVALAAFATLAAALPGLPLPAATRGAVEGGRVEPVKRR